MKLAVRFRTKYIQNIPRAKVVFRIIWEAILFFEGFRNPFSA